MNEMNSVYPLWLIGWSDDSLVGLNIYGWKVYKVEKSTDEDKLSFIPSISERQLFHRLEKHFEGRYDIKETYIHNDENPYYLVFYNEDSDCNPYEIKKVFDILRVYKTARIGLFNFLISIQEGGGGSSIQTLGPADFRVAPYMGDIPLYSLTDTEREEIQSFSEKVNQTKYPEIVDEMLEFYHQSWSADDYRIGYILRVTVLEMLISAQIELSYRVSRNIAVLLGRDREESKDLFDKVRKIYSARSKYLHEGNKNAITIEYAIEALDISRRLIKCLMLTKYSKKDINDLLNCSGFGDNPLHVNC